VGAVRILKKAKGGMIMLWDVMGIIVAIWVIANVAYLYTTAGRTMLD